MCTDVHSCWSWAYCFQVCLAGGSLPYPGRVLPQHICMRRVLEERDIAQLPRPQIIQEAAQRKDVTALVVGFMSCHLRQNS